MSQRGRGIIAAGSRDETNKILEVMRGKQPVVYNDYLRWFRVKRTLIEAMLDRGYGGAGNVPDDDIFGLKDDTDLIYYDPKKKLKIGYDAEREREKLVDFVYRHSRLAQELQARIDRLPEPVEGQPVLKLFSWRAISFVDALSNVYYSQAQRCYLYVRITDMNHKEDNALNAHFDELKSAMPVCCPGLQASEPFKYIQHGIYVFADSERDNKVTKKMAEQLPSYIKAKMQIFFASDLVFNITQHYLNPQFAMQHAKRCPPKGAALEPTSQSGRASESAPEGAEGEEEPAAENEASDEHSPLNQFGAGAALARADGLKPSDLPILLETDPIAKYYHARTGDIAQVTNFPYYNTFVPAVRTSRYVHI